MADPDPNMMTQRIVLRKRISMAPSMAPRTVHPTITMDPVDRLAGVALVCVVRIVETFPTFILTKYYTTQCFMIQYINLY